MSRFIPRSGQRTSQALNKGYTKGYDGSLRTSWGQPVRNGLYGDTLRDDRGFLTDRKKS